MNGAIHFMKKEVLNLKKCAIIMDKTDVARSLVEHIENKEIAEKVYERHDDYTPWNIVHMNILKSFLKWRLNAGEDDIVKLFTVHRMIINKSFRIIQENIAIAEELGFNSDKILKNGFLLNNYPTYARTILEDFSNLAGADMKRAIKHHPKLLTRPPRNIIKIYGILKEFEIPDELIRKGMSVFSMSPETVRARLQAIEGDPDMKTLLKHPRIIDFLLHHQKVTKRLSFLQDLQLRCASFQVLGTSNEDEFNDYIREGKDINHPADIIFFLKSIFKIDDPSLKDKIKRHPHYSRIPLKDMLETYKFLIHRKFRKMHIYKAVHILLYPKAKIEKVIKCLRSGEVPNVKYRPLSQVDRLNLIIYMIEKEHHFTGNGVWMNGRNKTENHPDITEETDLCDAPVEKIKM
ncbi:unnamed protein product [Acanthoscelides obtectus]|uniref:Uncharacterized protein n=1 Tax=Acanthoscelides obtectus TaxID=200917 RepID=A0A9P0KWI8_ACAOB|nr:unnamed protein product [Acanthoscelides obtectus]CAK1631207.1 Transcription termination factor 5, mitochondrial [Acanthoscelides obtectus]